MRRCCRSPRSPVGLRYGGGVSRLATDGGTDLASRASEITRQGQSAPDALCRRLQQYSGRPTARLMGWLASKLLSDCRISGLSNQAASTMPRAGARISLPASKARPKQTALGYSPDPYSRVLWLVTGRDRRPTRQTGLSWARYPGCRGQPVAITSPSTCLTCSRLSADSDTGACSPDKHAR